MKPITNLFSLLLLIGLVATQTLLAQDQSTPVASSLMEKADRLKELPTTELLSTQVLSAQVKEELAEEVESASYLKVNTDIGQALHETPAELLKLQLPDPRGGTINLQLEQSTIFSPGFQVFAASNRSQAFPYQHGAYYWGIVEGHPNSIAAISIFPDEVAGVIHLDGSAFNLGKVADRRDGLHIIYRAEDMLNPPSFGCGSDDLPEVSDLQINNRSSSGPNNCVNVYFEVDYDLYVNKGGVSQATNYLTGLFNQVAILYANESINTVLSEVVVWDVPDPYSGSSSNARLVAFRDYLNGNYNGDLAHLASLDGGGGIAYVNVLCNPFYGIAYSGIGTSYAQVPTYSWSVMVVAHEMGHNLGSPHTHACAWNGNNTAIDGCGTVSGCPTPPIPAAGTIMSYCHIINGVGIDFNLGFGPQPGALIRDKVYNASCLQSCGQSNPDDAGIATVIQPSGTICASTATPLVELSNYGSNSLTSVTIEYRVDNGTVNTYAWSGNLASGSSTQVTLPSVSFSVGSHTFNANTNQPNGTTDGNTANDASSGSFTRDVQETFYFDNDGDGYGDPNVSLLSCGQPANYTDAANAIDCNDNDAAIYPGASCSDGDVCTTGEQYDASCNCTGGSVADSDGDGVCDGQDICPGGDDNVDSDGDGIPDFCDCNPATATFNPDPLTHSGTGSTNSDISLPAGSKDVSFTVSGLDARLGGKPNNRYEESITITYVDGSGSGQTYGTFNGGSTSSVQVDILGEVQSVTISLRDAYDGNPPSALSVDPSEVQFCSTGPCPDSDGDGVCDANDICPGGDDNIDTDGDGIPDFCDSSNCNNPTTTAFSPSNLTHSGTGNSTSVAMLGGTHTGASFTITNLNARTSGNPGRRYIEQVDISYTDGNGNNVFYGTFTGDVQSSVSVDIVGEVQAVEVALSDAYDGNSSTTLSVNLGDVTSCLAALPEATPVTIAVPMDVELFPNPARNFTTLKLNQMLGNGEVIVRNILGAEVRRYVMKDAAVLQLNTGEWSAQGQVYLVTLYPENGLPITKRLVVKR